MTKTLFSKFEFLNMKKLYALFTTTGFADKIDYVYTYFY